MSAHSPRSSLLRQAHPLACELIERLRVTPGATVLEIGIGRGRNTAALKEAGAQVTEIEDDINIMAQALAHLPQRSFDAALSTHGLLHGTHGGLRRSLDRIASALKSGAPLYAVFGSVRDARFGRGCKLADGVYAQENGDEAGVAHAYFTEDELRTLLKIRFEIESLEETLADEIVGRWAHTQKPAGFVHWFAYARTKGEPA